jgi:hypothetical protein
MEDIIKLPDEKICIVCTGSQGEMNAVLNRMITGAHKYIKIKSTDTIVFSSNPIPGNEPHVVSTVDGLLREGAQVIQNGKTHLTNIGPLHLSGHAYYEELSADKSHIQHYRQRLKDYNLKEWPGYIESGKDDWAKRVLGYGRLGRVLERKETLLHQLINENNAEYIGYMVEYDWVQGAEKNTPFEELSHRYDDKVDSNICNKKVYDEFCKTEYTIRDLKNDLRSMAESVNTPQEEY